MNKNHRPNYLRFGNYLRRILHDKNLSQRKLARFLKVSAPAVNNWVLGWNLPVDSLIKEIAQFLEISEDEIRSNIEIVRAPNEQKFSLDELEFFCQMSRAFNKDMTFDELLHLLDLKNKDASI